MEENNEKTPEQIKKEETTMKNVIPFVVNQENIKVVLLLN